MAAAKPQPAQKTAPVHEDLPASPRQVLRGLEYQVDALRSVGEYFHQRGWSLGTSSNYSLVVDREPLELLITASGKDKGRLARTDFVRIDGAGNPTAKNQPAASAERHLHVMLAEAAAAGAILHTHSVWGTVLSDRHFESGGLAIEGYEMLKGLRDVKTHQHREWIPIYENTQDIPALAERVRSDYESSSPRPHGFLIRRHGLYTWGADLDEARRHIEIFEFLFEVVARTSNASHP
ncbi:MAG: methylthioribulose 1-phosphate dehydratase [Planctomycetes bacterium]|nr:methylthioribulose 1-phosphate dehydratase [Planctomycetota bacterium]